MKALPRVHAKSADFFKSWTREQIALVALYKSVSKSNLLSLLCKKEWHKWFVSDSSKSLSKTSDSIEKINIFMFLTVFYCFSPCRYLQMTKRERFALFHGRIPLSPTKNELFARKTDKWIPNLHPSNPWFLSYCIFFGIRHLPLPWDIQYIIQYICSKWLVALDFSLFSAGLAPSFTIGFSYLFFYFFIYLFLPQG